MISITNTQRRFPIDEARITTQLSTMLRVLKYDDFTLSILICGEKKMATYNEQYRNKKGATDILSFPYHTDAQPGKHITPDNDDDKNLGDIILCPAVIERKRHEWGHDFDTQLTMLLAHGVAHLLNYEHNTDEQHATMQDIEKSLLRACLKIKPAE